MSPTLHSQGVSAARIAIAILVCFSFFSPAFAENSSQLHPVEAAKIAIKAKNDEEALKILSPFVRSNSNAPEAIEARFLLGQVQSRQRRTDQALANFRLVISSGRGTEWAAMALEETAKLHETRRNPSGAQQARDVLLSDYPASSVAARQLWTIASKRFEAADYRNALDSLTKYLANPHARNQTAAEQMREVAEHAIRGDHSAAQTLLVHRYRERGESLLSRGLYARALSDFEQSLSNANDPILRIEVARKVALCLIMTGEEKRALGVLNRETTRNPEGIPALAQQLAESMGDFQKAEPLATQYLQQALQRFPGSDSTRVALLQFAAAKAHRLKRPLEAVPRYEEFLQRYPVSPESASAHYQLAAAQFHLENVDAAEAHFQKALEAYPSESLRAEIEKFLNVIVRAREAEKYLAGLSANDRDFFHAKRFHTQRKFLDASRILLRLSRDGGFRNNPHFREAQLLLGDCHIHRAEPNRAIAPFEQVLRSGGKDKLAAKAIVGIGKVHVAGGNVDRAAFIASRFSDFESLPKEAYDFVWRLAAIHFAEGRQDAAAQFIKICSRPSAPPSIQLPAARIAGLMAETTSHAELRGLTAEAANNLALQVGEELIQAREFEVAEELLQRLHQRAIACQPDRAAYLFGAVSLLQEKVEQAAEAFSAVLSRHLHSSFAAPAAIRLAIIYTGWLDDPKTGGKFLERAVNDYPDSPHRPRALFFLATLNLWNDDSPIALDLFSQLIEEYPGADEVPYALINIEHLKTKLRIP